MQISVVLPVYNVDEFLSQCLDSVLYQSFRDIEIIIINDGSTDSSEQICDNYAKKDNRIKVFHTTNSGVAAARERGVREASAPWIAFVDPDDSLPLNALEILSSKIAPEVDIVCGGYYHKHYRSGRLGYHYNRSQKLNQQQYIKQLFTKESYPAPWGKIFRKTLFGQNSFPRFKTAQDCLMNFELGTRVRNVLKINKPVYCYLTDRTSSSFTTYKPNLEYQERFNQKLRDIFKQNGMEERYKKQLIEWRLGSLRELILAGVEFSGDDKRVRDITSEAKGFRLNAGDNFVRLSIRHRGLRRLRFVCLALTYLKVSKIVKGLNTVYYFFRLNVF